MNYLADQWVCPHCGHQHTDLTDSKETSCDRCGARFLLIATNNTSIDYVIDRATNRPYTKTGNNIFREVS